MKVTHLLVPLSTLLLGVTLIGCKHNPQEEPLPTIPVVTPLPTNDSVSFQTEIFPLIISNCTMNTETGCHDAGGAAKGIILDSYDRIFALVNVDNPNESDLLDVIQETDPKKRMPPPPAQPLSQKQIDLITKWINEGARNTNIPRCDTNTFTYSGGVSKILATHCNGCHSNTASGGGILLTTYDNTKVYALNGKLLCSVQQNGTCSPMPKGGTKLDDCKIKVIQKWIDAGSLNN